MLARINELKSADGKINQYVFINSEHITDAIIQRTGNEYFIEFKLVHGATLISEKFNNYKEAHDVLANLFKGQII